MPITTFAPIAAGGVNTQPITSFTYENVGVNIDITPRLHHDDEVTLTLKVSLSSISGDSGFGGLPTFGNREITTTIRLKDGETNMLAGLIRDDERTVLSGVPGLSDIPMLGRLFANNHRESAADRHHPDADAAHRPRAGSDRSGSAPVQAGTRSGRRVARRDPRRRRRHAARRALERPAAVAAAAAHAAARRARAAPAAPRSQPPFPQPLQGTLPGTMLPAHDRRRRSPAAGELTVHS